MNAVIESADHLRQIVEQSESRLRGFSETESQSRGASSKWSRKEVLGHLIDSASNNHQRFVRSQLNARLTFPGYTQDDWNRVQQYRSETWANLVTLWGSYNRHLAHVMAAIPESARGNTCEIGQGAPVTLEFLVIDYVKHLEHHLLQILGPNDPVGSSPRS